MKKILTILISAVLILSLVSCDEAEEKEKAVENVQKIADNSTYQGAVSNYYRAFEKCDAAYQMATFAPQYKEYVIEGFGYKDEEEMTKKLQSIIDQSYASYAATFGEGFMLFENIKAEKDLLGADLEALKAEMKENYGRDFPITEAKELEINIMISKGQGDQTGGVTVTQSAGQSNETLVVGKIENDGWYILK